jgi:exopolysaccharide production protein ExoZ
MTTTVQDHEQPDKLPGVQWLRAIAATAVVVCHAYALLEFKGLVTAPILGGFLNHGYLGVDLFFVISGFIITITALTPQLTRRMSPGRFILRRAARILPLMWLAIISYGVLKWVATQDVPIEPYVRAMVLWPIGDYSPTHIWTIRHEFIFYAVFCLTLLAWSWRWFIIPLWIGLYFVVGAMGDPPRLAEALGSSFNLEFGMGVGIGIAYRKLSLGSGAGREHLIPIVVCVGFLGIMAGSCAWSALAQPLPRALFAGLCSSALVVVALFARGSGSRLSRLGTHLGDASYSIYLFHLHVQPPLAIVLIWLHPGLHPVLLLAILTIIPVMCGVVIHRFVERPLTSWCQRLVTPPHRAPASAAGATDGQA